MVETSLGLLKIRSKDGDRVSPVERLRRLAALERADVFVVVTYSVAAGLVSLAVPVAAQSLVSTVAFTALEQPVIVLSVLVLLGLLVAGLLRALQLRVVETLQQRFFVRFAHECALRLEEADERSFAGRTPEEVMNRFFDVAVVQKTSATLLVDGLAMLLQAAVSLVLLAFYHPALLAFDIVLVVIVLFLLFGLGRRGVETSIEESKAKYATGAWLQRSARAVIESDPPADLASTLFAGADAHATSYVKARRRHFRILFRQTVGGYLLQAFGTAALLGLGGLLVKQGQLSLGQLVAAELIVASVLGGAAKFGKYLESYYDLCASVDKVGQIVDLAAKDGPR